MIRVENTIIPPDTENLEKIITIKDLYYFLYNADKRYAKRDDYTKKIRLTSEIDTTQQSAAGSLYIDASDSEHITMRIGDGSAYIQDLPAVELGKINNIEELLQEHLSKTDYHTKVYIDNNSDSENLILTTL